MPVLVIFIVQHTEHIQEEHKKFISCNFCLSVVCVLSVYFLCVVCQANLLPSLASLGLKINPVQTNIAKKVGKAGDRQDGPDFLN